MRKSCVGPADTPLERLQLVEMRSIWIPLKALVALGLALSVAGALGCTKSSAGCDSSQCAAGNQCIDDGTGAGATCHKVCAAQSDCPANWYCNDGLASGGDVSWCVPNATSFAAGSGEWGASCAANKGEGANPDCNWNLGFACYGLSPTDANAYCTQFACTSDSDCAGGYWCSTQNVGPNVTSSSETFGKTRQVCVKRTYCAPCKKDLDCYTTASSTPMHCVPDVNGATFCSPQCSSDSACDYDATCTAPWKVCTPAAATGATCTTDDQCPPANGTYQHCLGGTCTPECSSATDCATGQKCAANTTVCIPRAGVCVGNGTFCSPCRSDEDCMPSAGSLAAPQAPGYCLSAEPYSQERFCSAPSTVADCDAGAADPPGCPALQKGENWLATGCTGTGVAGDPPTAQCFGIVTFGTASGSPTGIQGCWTVNR
jgi:hypothetical protein